jgi:predicted heme/steroid binding protein
LPSESGGESVGHCTSWRDGHGFDLNTAAVELESDLTSTFKNGAETCGQVF